MASSHGSGGQPHPLHDGHATAAAGPQLDVGEHDLIASRANNGLEATDAFQQAPAQSASGRTYRSLAQTLSSQADGHDEDSRIFRGAQNAERAEANATSRMVWMGDRKAPY